MQSFDAMTTSPCVATMDAALRAATRLPASCPPLILGSQSASRRALLAVALGHGDATQIESMSPNIDEKAIGERAQDPQRLVLAVANAKADALVARLASAGALARAASEGKVLVCGDQVVTYEGAVREKPVDVAQAREFVASYRRAPCATVGAICVHDLERGTRVEAVHVARVHYAPFPDDVVEALAGDPGCRRCAGALMVEHPSTEKYIRQIDGGVDSVMGLSTEALRGLIERTLEARQRDGT